MLRRRKGSGNFGNDIMPNFAAYRRIMIRKLGRLPKVAQAFVFLSLIFSIFLYGWIMYSVVSNPFRSDSFTERDKCPACFGTHICSGFREGQAGFSGFSRLKFLHFLNAKNVFFGYYGDDPVVYKRLAHTGELQAFDERLCVKAGYPMNCDPALAIRKHMQSGTKWILQKVKGQSDMMTCPTERLLDSVLHHYEEKLDAVDLDFSEKLQLLTTLLINPEPIIIQTFPQSKGYPFPKYYGSCGRMVVEEYIGHSLLYYFDSPWHFRVKLAYQILQIAEKFTENPSQYGLYWTDLTYDNLAVDKHGQVRVIDAENIIVVDKWQIKKDNKPGWDEPYYAEFDDCPPERPSCLSIYPNLLCDHYTSDFNYYITCRNLLSGFSRESDTVGGLLHHTPSDVEDRYNLEGLLDECAKPASPGARLKVKDELLEILKTLSRGFS